MGGAGLGLGAGHGIGLGLAKAHGGEGASAHVGKAVAGDGYGGKAIGGDAWGGNGGHGGDGGTATTGAGGAGGAGGMWGAYNGDDSFINGLSEASADAVIDTTAFNQQIVMGANILGNTVDMTVVGGNYTSTLTGEDAEV